MRVYSILKMRASSAGQKPNPTTGGVEKVFCNRVKAPALTNSRLLGCSLFVFKRNLFTPFLPVTTKNYGWDEGFLFGLVPFLS